MGCAICQVYDRRLAHLRVKRQRSFVGQRRRHHAIARNESSTNDRFASYRCRPPCRAINISKTKLEGLFAEELERLQPTPGYMRLIKESVLRVWHERKAAVKNDAAEQERRVKAIEQKLDPARRGVHLRQDD